METVSAELVIVAGLGLGLAALVGGLVGAAWRARRARGSEEQLARLSAEVESMLPVLSGTAFRLKQAREQLAARQVVIEALGLPEEQLAQLARELRELPAAELRRYGSARVISLAFLELAALLPASAWSSVLLGSGGRVLYASDVRELLLGLAADLRLKVTELGGRERSPQRRGPAGGASALASSSEVLERELGGTSPDPRGATSGGWPSGGAEPTSQPRGSGPLEQARSSVSDGMPSHPAAGPRASFHPRGSR